MTPDSDAGIDKQEVLAAVSGAPASVPPPPPAERPPSAVRPVVPPPEPVPKWIAHRSEIAGIVAAFVGILWLSVGIARGAWGPSLLGILFGIGALAIWAIEVWSAD